ncbi:MAG: hypothetical protein JWO13_3882 [Acidobacteriales bacterium]|nr:hypothetical protein [Terriglobales bacterium]
MRSLGSHPTAADVGAQVLVEVRFRAVEGDLSDQARRELMERNLALLEPLVVSLRRHLAPRSNVVRVDGHLLSRIRRRVLEALSTTRWMRRVKRSPRFPRT